MGKDIRHLMVIAGLALAVPEAAMASIPLDCNQRDLDAATVPGGASFKSTSSPGDIDAKFSKLEPADELATLDGVITGTEIYYPFDTTKTFGFRVKLVVGVNGHVRCIALAPSRGQDVQPEWNAQRRAWAGSISKWRFRPLVIDGKATEALTDLDIGEFELPQRKIPMPAGDTSQVVISQDMPYFGYRIEVHGDGRAIYSNTDPYYFLGPQAYHVGPESVARLLHEAEDADFWSLRDVYPPYGDNKGELISRIAITLGGQTKSLTEYEQAAGTGLLRDAHFLAFGVRHVIDLEFWRHPTLSTINQLERNGFDFKSEAAGRFLLQIAEDTSVGDEVVLAVMKQGAPVNAFGISHEDEAPRDLAEAALSAGRVRIASELIDDGALMNDSQTDRVKVDRAFQAAIESGKLAPVELILPFQPDLTFADSNAGNVQVSVLFKIPVRYLEDPPPTALAQRLLALGIDVNTRAADGQTLLHRQRDNEVMTRFLLDHGADINALDNEGKTPLVSGDDEGMTLLLLERGANPRLGNNAKEIRDMLASGRWPRVKLWLRAHRFGDVTNKPPA